jgi:hypothetical protein
MEPGKSSLTTLLQEPATRHQGKVEIPNQIVDATIARDRDGMSHKKAAAPVSRGLPAPHPRLRFLKSTGLILD